MNAKVLDWLVFAVVVVVFAAVGSQFGLIPAVVACAATGALAGRLLPKVRRGDKK